MKRWSSASLTPNELSLTIPAVTAVAQATVPLAVACVSTSDVPMIEFGPEDA